MLVKPLSAIIAVALLASAASAQLGYNKTVGLGVDDDGRPWIAGTFDTNGDGIADRIQMNRYSTAGADNVGFDPSGGGAETWLDIHGNTGVDVSSDPQNDQAWFSGDRDAQADGSRNDITNRRYHPGTGSDTLGYGIDVANSNIGTSLRGAGVQVGLNPSQPWRLGILDAGNRAGRAQASRFNEAGNENLGFTIPTVQAGDGNGEWDNTTISGIGLGNFNGNSISSHEDRLYITGVLGNGTPSIRHYVVASGNEGGGWSVGGAGAGDFGTNVQGLGVDPAIGQPWIVGERNDGIFAARRGNPQTGTDNLGFNITSSHGAVTAVEGIGISPENRQPWLLAFVDTNSSGQADRIAIQRYSIQTGQAEVDALISSQFTVGAVIPEPSAIALFGFSLAGLLGIRRRS